MNTNELIKYAKLVKSVRDAQNDYFKNRRQSDLVRSKNLERQLDVQTARILSEAEAVEETAKQLSFDGEKA